MTIAQRTWWDRFSLIFFQVRYSGLKHHNLKRLVYGRLRDDSDDCQRLYCQRLVPDASATNISDTQPSPEWLLVVICESS